MPSLTVTRIPHLDVVVIKQRDGKSFISTRDSIVIDTEGLLLILRFLVAKGIIDKTSIERMLND